MAFYRKKVVAIIFNKQAKVLLGKYRLYNGLNIFNKEISDWNFPGGGVENGESYKNAIYREIYEELGIGQEDLQLVGDIKKIHFLKYNKNQKDFFSKEKSREYDGKMQKFFFYYFVGDNKKININISKEFVQYDWFDINMLNNFINKKTLKFITIKYIRHYIYNFIKK